jgi:YbgC/YbaW family acyl-CoA thioester hydrolase
MAFTTSIDVRFGDCDPAGIVYYPVLYHYCHVAFEEAWREAIGIPYPELVDRRRLGFPTVHVETDFRAPARYGDRLALDVAVDSIGSASVAFAFDATAHDRAVFSSRHVTVCLDLDRYEKCELPSDIRAALARLRR